mgnify:CR=1 FL=1|tara:strand:- start:1192 stop:1596 length:405 start_codon:yes stop_codon:yes gene_type:complete
MIKEEQWNTCLALIREGLNNKDAAIMAGISEATLYNKKNEDDAFAQKMIQAKIAYKLHHLNIIKKKAKENWVASAWILERQFKEEFGKETKIEHTLQPFTHIQIEEKFDEYEEIETKNNKSISKKLNGTEGHSD